ncbi:MAG: Hsp20/alpha crystallin family protein [Chloroflexi bacterium]|nr:Hsp20/alpha crystallin family protein [Chloroflexota bacterium]
MTMQRWNSANDLAGLRRSLSVLLGGNTDSLTDTLAGADIPIDMHQTKNALVVKASVPGVPPDEIDISVSGNLLTIQAVTETDEDVSEGDYFVREHQYGLRSRSVPLPVEVDADQAEAAFDHGVLTITLPKASHAKAKPVKVKTAARAKAARSGGRPTRAGRKAQVSKPSAAKQERSGPTPAKG